jgi:hypothetical protein
MRPKNGVDATDNRDGCLNRVLPLRKLLLNWILVYIGNWCGALLTAYFFGYLGSMFDTLQYRSYLDQIVLAKLQYLSKSHLSDVKRLRIHFSDKLGSDFSARYRSQYYGVYGHDTGNCSTRCSRQNNCSVVSSGDVCALRL